MARGCEAGLVGEAGSAARVTRLASESPVEGSANAGVPAFEETGAGGPVAAPVDAPITPLTGRPQ